MAVLAENRSDATAAGYLSQGRNQKSECRRKRPGRAPQPRATPPGPPHWFYGSDWGWWDGS